MLTRRTFLTTIAAAPLARFCKTEPVRPYVFQRNVISINEAERRFNLKPGTLTLPAVDSAELPYYHEMLKRLDGKPVFNWATGEYDERRYALPQGTLYWIRTPGIIGASCGEQTEYAYVMRSPSGPVHGYPMRRDDLIAKGMPTDA